MVLYFTGTGGSRYIANKLAESTEDTSVSLNTRIKKSDTSALFSEKPFVFVTPTYAWDIPRTVREHIMNTEFGGSNKAYFVMTCGTDTGGAQARLKKLCAQKKLVFMGLYSIVMPENYIAMFKVPDEQSSRKIIRNAEPKIQNAAELINRGECFPKHIGTPLSALKSSVFNSMFCGIFVSDKKFRVKKSCVGCGRCERLCPVNNIKMVGAQPFWNGKCIHCMACISSCPQKAIEYGNASVDKNRFYLDE